MPGLSATASSGLAASVASGYCVAFARPGQKSRTWRSPTSVPDSCFSSQPKRAFVDLRSPGARSRIDTLTTRFLKSAVTCIGAAAFGTMISATSDASAVRAVMAFFRRSVGSVASARTIATCT